MEISVLTSQRDNRPTRGAATWEQIVESLSEPRPTECTLATCTLKNCPHKAGDAWIAATFKGRRALENVELVWLFIADIDDVSDAELEAILDRIAHLRFIIHASHSDRAPTIDNPNTRRVRIIFALTRALEGREFPRFWRGATAALEIPNDEATKDASHLYYLPSRPADACSEADDGSGYLFFDNPGEDLPVDEILDATPMAVEDDDIGPSDFEIPEFNEPPADGFEAAARVLAMAWPSTNRNSTQLALSGALAREGWPVELNAAFCARVAEIQDPGNRDYRKRLNAAQHSTEKLEAGVAAICGWNTVRHYLGDKRDVVDEARKLLGMHVASSELSKGEQRWLGKLSERAAADTQKQPMKKPTWQACMRGRGRPVKKPTFKNGLKRG